MKLDMDDLRKRTRSRSPRDRQQIPVLDSTSSTYLHYPFAGEGEGPSEKPQNSEGPGGETGEGRERRLPESNGGGTYQRSTGRKDHCHRSS